MPTKLQNLNFNFEQEFTQNEGEDFLIVEGTMTTNSKDSDGSEIMITYKALKNYLKEHKTIDIDVDHAYFISQDGKFYTPDSKDFDPIFDRWQNPTYGDTLVGGVLELESSSKDMTLDDIELDDLPAVEIKGRYKITEPKAIEEIKSGELTGFSLLWSGTPLLSKKGNLKFYIKLDYARLTLTKNPKNPDCNDLVIAKQQTNDKKQQVELKAKPNRSFKLLPLKFAIKAKHSFRLSLLNYEVEAKAKIGDLDEVFAKYKATVNMSYSTLLAWSQNPVSKLASLSRSPISHNLELLDKAKANWTVKHITWANKAIAFVGRMSKRPNTGDTVKIGDKDTGYTKRDISLKNWAYNPK